MFMADGDDCQCSAVQKGGNLQSKRHELLIGDVEKEGRILIPFNEIASALLDCVLSFTKCP